MFCRVSPFCAPGSASDTLPFPPLPPRCHQIGMTEEDAISLRDLLHRSVVESGVQLGIDTVELGGTAFFRFRPSHVPALTEATVHDFVDSIEVRAFFFLFVCLMG